MPVFLRNDKDGSFYQYGTTGAKYYFTRGSEESKNAARKKAINQMYAVNKQRGVDEPIKIKE
jgi:hypothetical protein